MSDAKIPAKKPHGEYDALIRALAKANGHPDPDAFTAEVRKHLEAK